MVPSENQARCGVQVLASDRESPGTKSITDSSRFLDIRYQHLHGLLSDGIYACLASSDLMRAMGYIWCTIAEQNMSTMIFAHPPRPAPLRIYISSSHKRLTKVLVPIPCTSLWYLALLRMYVMEPAQMINCTNGPRSVRTYCVFTHRHLCFVRPCRALFFEYSAETIYKLIFIRFSVVKNIIYRLFECIYWMIRSNSEPRSRAFFYPDLNKY